MGEFLVVAQDANHKLHADEDTHAAFLKDAAELMHLMADTFAESMNTSDEVFLLIWEDFARRRRCLCEDYPEAVIAAETLGPVVGIATGFIWTTLSTSKSFLFVYLSAGIFAGPGLGGALGLLIAAVVIGMTAIVYDFAMGNDETDLNVHRSRLDAMVKVLTEGNHVGPEELAELRDCFNNVFKRPLQQLDDGDQHVVCFEGFNTPGSYL